MDDLTFAQHTVSRATSRIGKITADNDDGTYDVELAANAGSFSRVAQNDPNALFRVDQWVTLERRGPGWAIVGYSAYTAGAD